MSSQSEQWRSQRGARYRRVTVGAALVVAVWSGGSAAAFGADRGFESVSPPETRGYAAQGLAAKPDGESFYWRPAAGGQSSDPAPDDGAMVDVFASHRSDAGWGISWLTPDPDRAIGALGVTADSGLPSMKDDGFVFTTSVGASPFFAFPALFLGVGGAASSLVSAAPSTAPQDGMNPSQWTSSEDLASTVFVTTAGLDPDDTDGAADIYVRRGDSLFLVSAQADGSADNSGVEPFLPAGAIAKTGGAIGSPLQTGLMSLNGYPVSQGTSPMSPDGQAIVFATTAQLDPADTDGSADLYLWRQGEGVRLISDDERGPAGCPSVPGSTTDCSVDVAFAGMSADASTVYFGTSEPLLDTDTDGESDVYQFRADAPAGHRLTLATGGGAGVAYPLTVTPDGKMFFASLDRLGSDPPAGADPVIYRWDGSSIVTVAPVLDSDVFQGSSMTGIAAGYPTERTVRATSDGSALVFRTAAALDPADTDGAPDLYRWRAGTALARLSGNGSAPVTLGTNVGGPQGGAYNASFGRGRVISQDATRVFFTTTDALTPDAGDNGRFKLYEWGDGEGISLVSPAGKEAGAVTYVDNDESGRNVFFMTEDALVGGDRDGGAIDVYDARIGGGFAEPPPLVPCQGDGCQGPLLAPPGTSSDPLSSSTHGAGNVGPVAPLRRATSVKVAKPAVARGPRGTLKVTASGAGRITVTGTGVRRTSRAAGRNGKATLTVRLTHGAATTLRRKGSYRARLRVRFVPAQGSPRQAAATLRFRASTSTKGR